MGYVERYRLQIDFEGDMEELLKVLNSDYCKASGVEKVVAVKLQEDGNFLSDSDIPETNIWNRDKE